MAWVYPEETTEAVRHLVARIDLHGAWVPSLWFVEVGNVLQTGIRRARINSAFRDKTLADLRSWNLQVDADTNQQAWRDSIRLSDHHRLTLYDAIYLELALRRNLPLATLDRALRSAAEGVLLLGL